MLLFTPDSFSDISSFFSYHIDWSALRKGNDLYAAGKARVTAFSTQEVACQVEERGRFFNTFLRIEGKSLNFSCTCFNVDNPRYISACRHLAASVFVARDYANQEFLHNWAYRMDVVLNKVPKPKKVASTAHQQLRDGLAFAGLQVRKNANALTCSFNLQLHVLPLPEAEAAMAVLQSEDPTQAGLEILTSCEDLSEKAALFLQNTSFRLVNFSLEQQQIASLMIANMPTEQGYSPYIFTQPLPLEHLSLLAQWRIPIFWLKKHPCLLNIYPETVKLQAVLEEDMHQAALHAGFLLENKAYTVSENNLRFLQDESGVWALAGDNWLARIDNPESLTLAQHFPFIIPTPDVEAFRQSYMPRISQHMPLVGDVVRWKTVQATPVPRLYITAKEEEPLQAELRFGYDEYELTSTGLKAVEEERIPLPGEWGGAHILRQAEKERAYHDLLMDVRYGLKRAGASQPGLFQIRARTHPLDFLMKSIPALTQAGFEIYGDKDIAKVNHYKPTISLNISSGIDWFDVQAIVQYGDQQVGFGEVRQALKRGEKYIKLADGSVGQIPEEWLQRYKHLFALAEKTADGLRVSDLQISLLDDLLAEAETQNIAPEFDARRKRLKAFEKINEQPLPQGFSGELRPYQKAGYDWMHFLRQYGFGGILADDMGLGKTVQTLVFLLSLKERGELDRPALLVLPKSLLVNWQREVERFTPSLRILQFTGQTRKKEPEHFEAYDIISTTYGTMLRDIEFLRTYRFSYAILDESQAIKNPLAQSSKASRLLNADYRLCLTGTPVENNVFELWSQFTFLNPGLLGHLEYFKSEFASAIERRDEASQPTADLLRRLTYPFILRRTKEQVAPELPPRTERIIFTELGPQQRKLYQQTREHYRQLLLGVLEESGDINDVRFKILEGLLRLRQMCIHPRLVEPTYRGESAKFENLLETMETLQAEGHKALIFSQFVQTLNLLREEMQKRGLAYTYLDGQTQNRQEQVDRFQNDPQISFFLISLKAGGFGLNLTAADYVLHIDPWWNPAVEMQASDRAHRIGQDKPVFVYKFIARDTVEEKILQLQERKRELVEQIISAEGSFFKSLNQEDVQILFS